MPNANAARSFDQVCSMRIVCRDGVERALLVEVLEQLPFDLRVKVIEDGPEFGMVLVLPITAAVPGTHRAREKSIVTDDQVIEWAMKSNLLIKFKDAVATLHGRCSASGQIWFERKDGRFEIRTQIYGILLVTRQQLLAAIRALNA